MLRNPAGRCSCRFFWEASSDLPLDLSVSKMQTLPSWSPQFGELES